MRKDDTPEDLTAVEIGTLGCEVVRKTENRMLVLEPLSWKAPSVARPYCCLVDTVVFHVWPWEVVRHGKNKGGYREYDRVRHLLPWEVEFLHEGEVWTPGLGFVFRRRGGWWMQHTAWKKQPFVIPALVKAAERREGGMQGVEGGMQRGE
jgi:hypothetical protein